MKSERVESDKLGCAANRAERSLLEKNYRDQLPACDRQDDLLCVHLGYLFDRLVTLSGLQIIQGAPVRVEALRLQTQFVCADICVNAVSGLLMSGLERELSHFLRLWRPFKELHGLILDEAREQSLDTAVHSLFFGAAALRVIANCENKGFELEPEWIPLSHRLAPGAFFDGSANEELERVVAKLLRNEIERIGA